MDEWLPLAVRRSVTKGGCGFGTWLTLAGAPIELGAHDDRVSAVAALPDGRIVTACDGEFGRSGPPLRLWDPNDLRAAPIKLGRTGDHEVGALVVLPDGRMITGGRYGVGPILIWNPKTPRSDPINLGVQGAAIGGMAVLADGRLGRVS